MSEADENPIPPNRERLTLADEAALRDKGLSDAQDSVTGRRLVAVSLSARELDAARLLATASHAHLSPISVVEGLGVFDVAVTEPLFGLTLADSLRGTGKRHPVEAVRIALRLADGLHAVHELGAAHGRVHPGNVVIAPEKGPEPQLHVLTPGERPFHLPTWQPGTEPLRADDEWAVHALLCAMLTGEPPPMSGLENGELLEPLGVQDPVLCARLIQGLSVEEKSRENSLFELRRELARWFVHHAGEEPVAPGSVSHRLPPPLPHSIHPPQPRPSGAPAGSLHPQGPALSGYPGRSLPPPKSRWSSRILVGTLAIAVGLVTWVITAKLANKRAKPAVALQSSAPPKAPAAPAAVNLAEVPVTGREQRAGDATASCVAGYLKEGLVDKGATLDSMCSAKSFVAARTQLEAALTPGKAEGRPAAERLGWYSLPLLSGLRSACCADPFPIKPEALAASCAPAMDASLGEFGRALAGSRPLEDVFAHFAEVVSCATKAKSTPPVAQPAGSPGEPALRELLRPSASP